jgi:hypothetical protein
MNNVVYEDGLGNQYDNKGNEIMDIQMEVDNNIHPIENVTNFDIYIDLKPSEKEARERERIYSLKSLKKMIKGAHTSIIGMLKRISFFFLLRKKE